MGYYNAGKNNNTDQGTIFKYLYNVHCVVCITLTSSEDSAESAHMHRLVRAFEVRRHKVGMKMNFQTNFQTSSFAEFVRTGVLKEAAFMSAIFRLVYKE